ncbi:MAG TPA: alpha/beta hydrolase [Caulobacteraceae bacterium]|nr:alpha/beta hydrolase [Caulobacteraceae bacterium]
MAADPQPGAQAPLISIPEAPAPAGAEARWIAAADGVLLRAALFQATAGARGSVLLSPGRTEPIEKYFEVIGDLTGRGFVVLAHDWRGQGLSQRLLPDRMRGHAVGFEGYLDDHRTLLDAYAARLPRPWISLGHSMGGCLELLALAKGERRLDATFLSAPMLAISTRPWPVWMAMRVVQFSEWLGRGPDYALPTYDPAVDRFGFDRLTHDRARYDRYKAQLRACPELAIGALTWGWLDFALKAGAAIAAPGVLEAVDIPVSIVAAAHDHLVLNSADREAARRLPKSSYQELDGAFHEILMESDPVRNQVFAAFDQLAEKVTSPRA